MNLPMPSEIFPSISPPSSRNSRDAPSRLEIVSPSFPTNAKNKSTIPPINAIVPAVAPAAIPPFTPSSMMESSVKIFAINAIASSTDGITIIFVIMLDNDSNLPKPSVHFFSSILDNSPATPPSAAIESAKPINPNMAF